MGDPIVCESTVEAASLGWLENQGWAIAYGPDIAPATPIAERDDYGEFVLEARLRSVVARLNPDLPSDAIDDAHRRLTRPVGATLEARNRDFHQMLVAGVTVEYADADGRVRGDQVRVVDFDVPEANDWLAVNQFTVVENKHERRPDIVLFVNGLPLAVIELKNPADENATIHTAFQQLQTYKAEIPSLLLTGFDAPSLHTMYVDKPMRGHGLMQAIARVNRVFRDKPGGLVVDYLGLAHELKRALATYTESGGRGETALDKEQAVQVMLEKYEVCCGLFHGFDRTAWAMGSPAERLHLLPAALEHVLAQEDGKARCLKAVRELSQAFALAVPHPEAVRIRDDVSLFQHVRAALSKRTGLDARSDEALDHAVRQIVSRAVAPDGVLDIFAAAGLKTPDVSVLSEDFLREVRGMRRRNLAVELLEKLLKGELATRRRKNVVQARSFAEMLEQTIRRYQNRAVEAAQVIEDLIGLAREMREANARGEVLWLSDDELAFYDALGVNDSAVQVLGDETLRDIARELVETVRNNLTVDWTLRENIRAKLRVLVKRILRKHGYPPDKQESATRTVLEQAEVLSTGWAT